MTDEAFKAWGWRIPFIISIFLVGVSLYIRLRMKESPIFQQIKGAGMTSSRPLVEAFTQLGQPEACFDFVVWRDSRTGRGLVHRSVLCALLFADGLEGESALGAVHHRDRAAVCDAVVCVYGRAFRSYRAQMDHDGWDVCWQRFPTCRSTERCNVWLARMWLPRNRSPIP